MIPTALTRDNRDMLEELSNLKKDNPSATLPIPNDETREGRICRWLTEANLVVEREVSFRGLLGLMGNPLRFDFLIHVDDGPKIILEYHGPYHDYRYLSAEMYGRNDYSSLSLFVHDERKRRYLYYHGIPMITLYLGLDDELEKAALFQYINHEVRLYKERHKEQREFEMMQVEDKADAFHWTAEDMGSKIDDVTRRRWWALEKARADYCGIQWEMDQLAMTKIMSTIAPTRVKNMKSVLKYRELFHNLTEEKARLQNKVKALKKEVSELNADETKEEDEEEVEAITLDF